MVNPIVAKQFNMMLELCHRYQSIFIHELDNFFIGNISV